jgi:hypothetical protein
VTIDKVETPVATVTRDSVTVDVAAIAAALALTSASGFFGVVGMTAIFTAEPVPVTLINKTRAQAVRALPYADDLGMDIDDTGLVMPPLCRRAS